MVSIVTRSDIVEGLQRLELNEGAVAVVHSSLSSFGRVDGGADAVVDALLEALGAEGTLIVPTFNYAPDPFDPARTPSLTGAVPEAVRARPEATRSLHPTHSVTAIGPIAIEITRGHEKTHSFARGSALFKALQAGAVIVQLGTTSTTNSMVHVAEEIVGVPYLERSRLVRVRTKQGQIVERWLRRPGCSRGFGRVDDVLFEQGLISEQKIGACRARLMRARDVVDTAVEMLRFDPESLLCTTPDCEVCAESRAMVAATETERQDQEVIRMAEEEEQAIRRIEHRFGVIEVTDWTGPESSSPN